MLDMFNLTGRVAVITGGHSWLGYDIACSLAEAGCNIVIASRSFDKVCQATDQIKERFSVNTLPLEVDVCDYEQVQNMMKSAFSWMNRIDILVNNAGGGSGNSEGDFLKRAPEDMEYLIRVNMLGTMFCSQCAGSYMVEQASGNIINLGSIAGIVGRDREMYRKNGKMEQPIDYSASKAGVIGMTRDLAAYFAPSGIRVNCISPGGFDKGDLPLDFVSDYEHATITRRMGTMGKDIKGAALFLASDSSAYITGHNLVVDGGFSTIK